METKVCKDCGQVYETRSEALHNLSCKQFMLDNIPWKPGIYEK